MTYGWISEAGDFAKRPLLGKTCAQYVQAAMEGCELVNSPEKLAGRRADMILVVREDAPCLQKASLAGLLKAGKTRPAVMMALDAELPLAIALNGLELEKVMGEMEALPAPEQLLKAMNDQKVDYELWHDEPAESYLTVSGPQQYAAVFQMLNQQNIQKHQQNGVIILDPDRTIIESDVTIGAGTMIYAGNMLQGATSIGAGCILYPNNRMNNAGVGDGTTVESSVLLDCSVGQNTTVGPYAYLRPKSKVGDHCRIGDFVEIKNSSIDNGTKVSHLTYVGDSDLGKDINLGCGVVFVNYDGKTKNRSRVDDHAFIGCNCNLVAPVHVGENAYLAAGSTVVEDVPKDALFVARSRGVVKEDWVKRRKEAGKL